MRFQLTQSVVGLALALAAPTASARDDAPTAPAYTLDLQLRVAICDGRPIVSDQWVSQHVKRAQQIYRRHQIELRAKIDHFTPSRCIALTRADRHSFYRHAPASKRVTVLIVARVRDLDVESYNLMGVHWRHDASKRRWIFLTARAKPPVLAHELGHYLGLRHDRRGGNLMTPGPSDPAWRGKHKPKPFVERFSDEQVRALQRAMKR